MSWSVYLVRCKDNSLYCGISNNIEKRVASHNSGKGAKYTRSRRPVILVYVEEKKTKQEAAKREYQIKQMSKKQKEILLKGF